MTLPSSGSAILAVSIVFALLAVMAVGLRTWARKITSVKFGWDDWLIVITAVSIKLLIAYPSPSVSALGEIAHFPEKFVINKYTRYFALLQARSIYMELRFMLLVNPLELFLLFHLLFLKRQVLSSQNLFTQNI